MGILENFENAWDIEVRPEPQNPKFESNPIPITDNMGREQFWDDMGRPNEAWTKGIASYDSLTVKLFSETVCADCGCKNE
jgi:hypothetical protein